MECCQRSHEQVGQCAGDDMRVAEIVNLAISTTSAADVKYLKSLLKNRIEDLLDKSHDHVIEQAIMVAPDSTIAQTIRSTAESASEGVRISRDGCDTNISLFVVPVITSFGEGVPVSQFKAALQGLNGSMELTNYVNGRQTGAGHVMLLPQMFRLDDLKGLSLSAVRKGTIALGNTNGSAEIEQHPFIKRSGSFKRSTEFLRYLVGRHVVTGASVIGCRRRRTGTRIQTLTKQTLERRIGLRCTVDAVYTGSFHDSLYTGMWRYQERRLDQVSHHTRNSTGDKNILEAKIVTHGHRDSFDIRVGFFSNGETIGGRSYLLGSRPGEDAGRCLGRVISRIEATGIRTTACETFVPLETGFALGKKRSAEPSMIAIPI